MPASGGNPRCTFQMLRAARFKCQPHNFYDYVNLLYRAEMLTLKNDEKIAITDLAECYRTHIGVFDFQQIYTELQKNKVIGEYDIKKQTITLRRESLLKSRRRLEKFYSTLLRN